MNSRYRVVLAILALLVPAIGRADTLDHDLSGFTPAGQAVAFHVHVDFTQTGGDFNAGTGTATVQFTLNNTSGLYPFQAQQRGNPILTAFYFNVPPGTGVTYSEARVLSGSTEFNPGDGGQPAPLSCNQLAADDIQTGWYQLETTTSAGDFGIFSKDLATTNGLNEGIVDPAVVTNCVKNGDVISQAAVAGQVRYTLLLSNLNHSLDSANDFLVQCSVAHGGHTSSVFAGHFQGCDNNGQGSAFVGETPCPTAARSATWGELKASYR
jgi:hypothetical protein